MGDLMVGVLRVDVYWFSTLYVNYSNHENLLEF